MAEKLTPKRIISTLEKHGTELRRYRVKKIGLFGSFLSGKQKTVSDIDFLVTFDRPTFDNYMELKFLLEKIFHKKVDLVMDDSIKPALVYVRGEAIYARPK